MAVRSSQCLWVLLVALLLGGSDALAATCSQCGKPLKFGTGTCAECKLEAARRSMQNLNEKHQLTDKARAAGQKVVERVEKTAESVARDGSVHRFQPQGDYRFSGSSASQILFINGMRTDFEDFQRQVQSLSDVLGRPITAVYAGGLTRGVATSVTLQLQNWSQQGQAATLPEGQALLSLLRIAEKASQRVEMICHSRGTMVTEAVLHEIPWTRENVTVYALGCAVSGKFPVRTYFKIVNRGDTLMKDRMVDTQGLVWGRSGTHDLEDYVQNLRASNYDAELPIMVGVIKK